MASYVPRDALKDNARRLFTLILVNYAVHNADAHLKNFALVYTNQRDVRLAPVYDVLSGTVYPEFATSNPALTLGGKKSWTAGAMLALFASSRLSLGSADIREAIERVSAALHQVTPMVSAYAERYPAFREVGKRMLDAWACGLEDIQRNAKPGKTTPAPLREQMGMSDADRAAARKEANPYANPDGAFSHKAR
jgi:serine/threonine-protein kinase HipA